MWSSAATVTRAGSHAILPLDAEEVRNTDGQETQDCELTAAKRLVKRLRAEHRQLSMCIVGDDLYGHEPLIAGAAGVADALRARRQTDLACGSLRAARGTGAARGVCPRDVGRRDRTPPPHVRVSQCRGRAPHAVGAVRVNFLEVWERRPDGTVGYHNSWVTDFVVTPETVAAIVGIGRSRWKIENEQFNVQKNHGYELEHNYGHGQQTLSVEATI